MARTKGDRKLIRDAVKALKQAGFTERKQAVPKQRAHRKGGRGK